MFDTHCHLNFKAYRKILDDVISEATSSGVTEILIPGTDVPTSQRAIEIASQHENYYAAVGLHPHHVFEIYAKNLENANETEAVVGAHIAELEVMMTNPKVVAVGELGIDRHMYVNTKYKEYTVTDSFVELQKQVMQQQMELAVKYSKSLIVHNREAYKDLLNMFALNWDSYFENRMVLHCCEANQELLAFAIEKHLFIGVDGDITYGPEKKAFIKNVPKEMLVLETDGPYLLPDPLRQEKKYPNKPGNLHLIAREVATAWDTNIEEVMKITTENAHRLFKIA